MERPGVMRGTISGADVCEGDTHFSLSVPNCRVTYWPHSGRIWLIFSERVLILLAN